MLQGAAYVASQTYTNLLQTALLARLKTASGNFLDIASNDFFGVNLPRIYGEADSFYLARILAKIALKKVTLAALTTAVTNMFAGTGVTFSIQEYAPNGANTNVPLGATPVGINIADSASRYGSPLQPFECALILVDDPANGSENIELEDGTDLQMEDGSTIDLEFLSSSLYSPLLALVSSIKPIATTVWIVVGLPLTDETNGNTLTDDNNIALHLSSP
jgi:hypothetical protein